MRAVQGKERSSRRKSPDIGPAAAVALEARADAVTP